jgi:hypothetical protein
MAQHLVVLRPFLNFVRGDLITDPMKVAEILESEHKRFVTKVTAPSASGV